MQKLGLIAGNGRFPFLLLDAARAHGLTSSSPPSRKRPTPRSTPAPPPTPTSTSTGSRSASSPASSKPSSAEGVTRAVMAGQVKHKQIFSTIRPDWRLAKLLLNLRTRNTDMLLGAIAKVLGDEGIELISSTHYLEPLLAKPGVLTAARPTKKSRRTSPTAAPSPAPSPPTTSARPSSSPPRPASPSKPWKAPTPPSSAPAPSSARLDCRRASLHPPPLPHRRQSRQAQSGHALRRPRHRRRHHRDHAARAAPPASPSKPAEPCSSIAAAIVAAADAAGIAIVANAADIAVTNCHRMSRSVAPA